MEVILVKFFNSISYYVNLSTETRSLLLYNNLSSCKDTNTYQIGKFTNVKRLQHHHELQQCNKVKAVFFPYPIPRFMHIYMQQRKQRNRSTRAVKSNNIFQQQFHACNVCTQACIQGRQWYMTVISQSGMSCGSFVYISLNVRCILGEV